MRQETGDSTAKGQNVLVTGGAGFIGGHLVELLLSQGHDVVVLDDFSTGKRANLPRHPRLTVLEGDVADEGAAREAMRGREVVFHLAAVASVQASLEEPLRTLKANLQGTVTMLEAAKAEGAKRFVYASSAAVYGDANPAPVSEAATPAPLSPYAADKLAGEHYLAHYHRQGWLQGSAFRFFNVFGPRQDPSSPYSGVISIFVDRAVRGRPVTIYGDGFQTRDFIFVGDLVRVLAGSLAWKPEREMATVNLGRGEPVTLVELLELVERVCGQQVARTFAAPRPGDIRHSFAQIGELRQRVDGLAFTSLLEGLRRTVATTSTRRREAVTSKARLQEAAG